MGLLRFIALSTAIETAIGLQYGCLFSMLKLHHFVMASFSDFSGTHLILVLQVILYGLDMSMIDDTCTESDWWFDGLGRGSDPGCILLEA